MLVAVTVAPGIVAPCWSLTVPVIEPYRTWAVAGTGVARATAIARTATAARLKRVN